MRKRKLRTDYHHKRGNQVIPFATTVIGSMAKNGHFPDGPTLATGLETAVTTLQTFLKAHPFLSPDQTVEKDQMIEAILQQLHLLALTCNRRFAEETYDESALLSTGLELEAERTARRSITSLPAPTDFRLIDGPIPNTLKSSCKLPTGAVMGLFLHTTDPNLPDDQWRFVLAGTDATINGYSAGTRVYVKAAGARKGLEGYVFTPVLTRIVQ